MKKKKSSFCEGGRISSSLSYVAMSFVAKESCEVNPEKKNFWNKSPLHNDINVMIDFQMEFRSKGHVNGELVSALSLIPKWQCHLG